MNAQTKSKRSLTYAAAAAFLLYFGGGPALAASVPGTFSGSNQSSACIGGEEKCRIVSGSKPFIKARIDWKLGPLIGEPVIDTRIAWRPDTVLGSVKDFVPPIYGEADPDLFYRPGEAAAQLRLYDAKARLTVHHGNQSYTIDSDLGVPDKAGDTPSYNVAGSPSWDRLFQDKSGTFIPASLAREIFASGSMAGAEASLHSAKLDTTKFEEWWLARNVERYAAPLRAAIDGRLTALEASFGLPTDDLRAEIAALQGGKNARALIGKLEGILQKLAPDRIPAKFLGEGPQKLARLHAYALRIGSTEDALRKATKGLPPMPGASKAYETWYDQVAVRMNNDAARLAYLQGRKAEAERAEYEAAQAELRVRQRAERLAFDKKNRQQAERRHKERNRRDTGQRQNAPSSLADELNAMADSINAGNSGFGGTGWGSSGGSACAYGTYDIGNGQCSYFYGSDSDSDSDSDRSSGRTDRICDAERNATDTYGADVNTDAYRSADAALHKCLYGN